MKRDQFSIKSSSIVRVLFFLYISWAAALHAEINEFEKAVTFVKEKNYAPAVTIFRALSEKGDHDAQYNLALLLKMGLGHPSNYSRALKWAWLSQLSGKTKAAKLSDELLSIVPKQTQDTVRDNVLSILSDRMKESDRGAILQKAQFHLTVLDEPDYISAYALRALGAAIGLEGAVELRNEIEGELEPEDLMLAQKQAAELFSGFDWSEPE